MTRHSVWRRWLGAAVAAFWIGSMAGLSTPAHGEEAEWIWSASHPKDKVPQTACYFRKQFNVASPAGAELFIAADDRYELYLNGRRIGEGESSKKLDKYDIARLVTPGRNILAIKVNNTHGSTAAVAARVMIQERNRWVSHSTDDTWRTSLNPLPLWYTPVYNDSRWSVAQTFGQLGKTVPWDVEETVAAATETAEKNNEPVEVHRNERFKVADEFEVERVIDGEQTGSLIAMTFNEFGHAVCAREDGGLLLVHDSNKDGLIDAVRAYCDKVKSVQGILCLNGEVFVTADGPDGTALYRLKDEDRNGSLEAVTTLLKFQGQFGEHGPHGIVLGPDGLLYIVVGNHTQPETDPDATSPHRGFYEGDLVTPRYEDPGGHAVGVKAPGGTILRVDIDGKKAERVAGGLRNAYDLAFNSIGDLFTWDSDMESDIGMTWYRPTLLFQILPGGEYGWRSGWANWPDYFVDNLPAVLETGRGSPAGAVVYNHYNFPKKYQDALFLADWSQGRIVAVTLKQSGASYSANTEVFLSGDPLNVTDLAIGPDGWLYFTTGGRGTAGGVYRVRWKGEPPAASKDLGKGLSAVIRQPQLESAWARQRIAREKVEMGGDWEKLLVGVAKSTANPWNYRTRALDVLQLFGPPPTPELLIELTKTQNEFVRAKAAELMGLHGTDETRLALIELLADSDRTVRRKACEALVRAEQIPPMDNLLPLLKSDDRSEAWAARRLLERAPTEEWRDIILEHADHRVFIEGGLALLIAHPSQENALAVIARGREVLDEFVSDRDFIDVMRLLQVAILRGEIPAEDLPELREQLAEEFPSGNHLMNREMVRLLAYLNASSIMDRYIEHLQSDTVPELEKLHLALHLRFIPDGWTADQRLAVLEFFETAQKRQGGASYSRYVVHVTRDFAKNLTLDEARLILADGARWPNASLASLYKLPPELDDELRLTLKKLDRDLADNNSPTAMRVKVGIVAVLARSGDEDSQAYLRQIWDKDPERRQAVAMGLVGYPTEANWSYLLRSLPNLDDGTGREVLVRMRSVNLAPEESEYYRQVILQGLRLKDKGADDAIALLEYWTERREKIDGADWKEKLAGWQKWYHGKWPGKPAAELPKVATGSKWGYEDLLTHLTSPEGDHGDPVNGAAVFAKAQCAKCHRFGESGESAGPDLTTVSKRFMRKEILHAIVYPSHVISDQYATKTIVTADGKQYAGIVAPGAAGEMTVLMADGKKVSVAETDIEETKPSSISVMPEKLLDPLTLPEISDLFAYLRAVPETQLAKRPADATTTK